MKMKLKYNCFDSKFQCHIQYTLHAHCTFTLTPCFKWIKPVEGQRDTRSSPRRPRHMHYVLLQIQRWGTLYLFFFMKSCLSDMSLLSRLTFQPQSIGEASPGQERQHDGRGRLSLSVPLRSIAIDPQTDLLSCFYIKYSRWLRVSTQTSSLRKKDTSQLERFFFFCNLELTTRDCSKWAVMVMRIFQNGFWIGCVWAVTYQQYGLIRRWSVDITPENFWVDLSS